MHRNGGLSHGPLPGNFEPEAKGRPPAAGGATCSTNKVPVHEAPLAEIYQV
jgi:hypothetical protein